LPLLLVCEDNRMSATTPTASMTGGEGAAARARAIGIPALQVDGNDAAAVDAAAARLIHEVRVGGGPRLLHAATYRQKGHVSVDIASYRDAAEHAAAMALDPLLRTRAQLLDAGVTAATIETLDAAARAEITAAVDAAALAPWPEPAVAYTDVQTSGSGTWR
jgi:pyruvate dehydrogenase E1 component alpha subunit